MLHFVFIECFAAVLLANRTGHKHRERIRYAFTILFNRIDIHLDELILGGFCKTLNAPRTDKVNIMLVLSEPGFFTITKKTFVHIDPENWEITGDTHDIKPRIHTLAIVSRKKMQELTFFQKNEPNKMKPPTNKVKYFFMEWAKSYEIELDHRWKAELVRKIGADANIKHSNMICTWIARGVLPEYFIHKVSTLDISDPLKKLCENCKKQPAKTPKCPLESKKSLKDIPSYQGVKENGTKQVFSFFQDENRAIDAINTLTYIETMDPAKYDEILEKIFGTHINLKHKNEKNFRATGDKK